MSAPVRLTRYEGEVQHFFHDKIPGSVLVMPRYAFSDGKCPSGWTNCDGRHVWVMLPDGSPHDLMARASNCALSSDTTHRCWVVHGEVPDLTVDKNGETCAAGAGSIVSDGWHGFVRGGFLVDA